MRKINLTPVFVDRDEIGNGKQVLLLHTQGGKELVQYSFTLTREQVAKLKLPANAPERSANKCPGCRRPVTREQVKEWDGFCDECLANGTNLETATQTKV